MITDNIIRLSINEIKDFDFPKDELFLLEIIEKGVKYEFLINLSSSNDNLICFGSGGRKKSLKPPIFQRYSWRKYFDESLIFL